MYHFLPLEGIIEIGYDLLLTRNKLLWSVNKMVPSLFLITFQGHSFPTHLIVPTHWSYLRQFLWVSFPFLLLPQPLGKDRPTDRVKMSSSLHFWVSTSHVPSSLRLFRDLLCSLGVVETLNVSPVRTDSESSTEDWKEHSLLPRNEKI